MAKSKNDLNVGTAYHDRCVDNSPELMSLDDSLNNDLQLSYRYHCAVTAHLPCNDARKFSLSTPLRITRGIKENMGGSNRRAKFITDSTRRELDV